MTDKEAAEFRHMVKLAGWVREHIRSNRTDEVVKELIKATESELSHHLYVIGVIRYLYPARSIIGNWTGLVGVVKDYLILRDRYTDTILKGLLDD